MSSQRTDSDGGTWSAAESPVSRTLRGVTGSATGPVAVGDGGVVVSHDRSGWRVRLADGPGGTGTSLRCADATDDGERVWVAGAAGTLWSFEPSTDIVRNRSRPRGIGATFRALAVTGARGEERVLAADSSGRALAGSVRNGRVDWSRPTRPAGRSVVRALCVAPDGVGYAVDGAGIVYRTTERDRWERVGPAATTRRLHAVGASDRRVLVGGDDGLLAERRNDGWDARSLDGGAGAVRGVDVSAGEAVAVGDGGTIHHSTAPGEWATADWLGTVTLWDAHLGPTTIAVGTRGTILERGTPR